MSSMPVCSTSVWPAEQIAAYLKTSVIPLRLGCIEESGFPIVLSLWYLYRDGALWCATHESARVSRILSNNPKCAFEVAPNEAPYKGVRGQGVANLRREEASQVLAELIDRFLGDRHSRLANWLLSRTDHEFAIRIDPTWVTSWDFSERMSN